MENDRQLESPSMFGMIMSPREQFEKIRQNPKVIVILITVTILAIISALLALESLDATLEAEMMGFSEDELLIFTIITQITTIVLATILPAIVILIAAAVYLLIAKIANTDVSFKQLFSMLAYIGFVTGLGGLLNGILTYFIAGSDPEVPITSLNSIIGMEGPLGVLFSSIELFSIWGIILTAIGLQVVAKFSKGLAWGIIIGFNVIMISIGMILVVIEQSLGTF
ncbi:MAG TPA: Yip1 family protein [Pseudogracilibacillus sp.]|nr:Yip1 family protein [Pseudogracilibacillus sp.]